MVEQLARLTPATKDVLDVLLGSTEPVWGLQLVQATDRPAGSIYPILARLERIGWVESEWEVTDRPGPRRRLYRMTSGGVQAARARIVPNVRAVTPKFAGGVA